MSTGVLGVLSILVCKGLCSYVVLPDATNWYSAQDTCQRITTSAITHSVTINDEDFWLTSAGPSQFSDCTVQSHNGERRTAPCNQTHRALCYVYPKRKTKPFVPQQQGTWIQQEGFEWTVIKKQHTAAIPDCEALSGKLAHLDSVNELQELQATLLGIISPETSVYMGGYNNNTGTLRITDYKWETDSSPIGAAFWEASQPSTVLDATKQCVVWDFTKQTLVPTVCGGSVGPASSLCRRMDRSMCIFGQWRDVVSNVYYVVHSDSTITCVNTSKACPAVGSVTFDPTTLSWRHSQLQTGVAQLTADCQMLQWKPLIPPGGVDDWIRIGGRRKGCNYDGGVEYVKDKILGCTATWSTPGLANAENSCNHALGFHICQHELEIRSLGGSASMCHSTPKNEFYASHVTGEMAGGGQQGCADLPKNIATPDDVFGCVGPGWGTTRNTVQYTSSTWRRCTVLNGIFAEEPGSTDRNGFRTLDPSMGSNEISNILHDTLTLGGVLCCKDQKYDGPPFYASSSSAATIDDARAVCAAEGAVLAEIRDGNQLDHVRHESNPTAVYYMDLQNTKAPPLQLNDFLWGSDGTTPNEYWATSQPKPATAGDSCGFLQGGSLVAKACAQPTATVMCMKLTSADCAAKGIVSGIELDRQDFTVMRPDLLPPVTTPIAGINAAYTPKLPTGWSVVHDSQMGTGSIEWQGWRISTVAFWTQASPKLAKNNFGQPTDMLLMADGQAWDGYTVYKSTAITPWYDVDSDWKEVVLRFSSTFVAGLGATGVVSQEANGGAITPLLTITQGDAYDMPETGTGGPKVVVLTTSPPPGQTRFHFQFDQPTAKPGFWGISNIVVTAVPPNAYRPVGCTLRSNGISRVFTPDGTVVGCAGRWDGKGVTTAGTQLCDIQSGYTLCDSQEQLESAGLTSDACSCMPQGREMFLSGVPQSLENGQPGCASQQVGGATYNDNLFGCGGNTFGHFKNQARCTVFSSLLEVEKAPSGWAVAHNEVNNEKQAVQHLNDEGGVLCCKVATPGQPPSASAPTASSGPAAVAPGSTVVSTGRSCGFPPIAINGGFYEFDPSIPLAQQTQQGAVLYDKQNIADAIKNNQQVNFPPNTWIRYYCKNFMSVSGAENATCDGNLGLWTYPNGDVIHCEDSLDRAIPPLHRTAANLIAQTSSVASGLLGGGNAISASAHALTLLHHCGATDKRKLLLPLYFMPVTSNYFVKSWMTLHLVLFFTVVIHALLLLGFMKSKNVSYMEAAGILRFPNLELMMWDWMSPAFSLCSFEMLIGEQNIVWKIFGAITLLIMQVAIPLPLTYYIWQWRKEGFLQTAPFTTTPNGQVPTDTEELETEDYSQEHQTSTSKQKHDLTIPSLVLPKLLPTYYWYGTPDHNLLLTHAYMISGTSYGRLGFIYIVVNNMLMSFATFFASFSKASCSTMLLSQVIFNSLRFLITLLWWPWHCVFKNVLAITVQLLVTLLAVLVWGEASFYHMQPPVALYKVVYWTAIGGMVVFAVYKMVSMGLRVRVINALQKYDGLNPLDVEEEHGEYDEGDYGGL